MFKRKAIFAGSFDPIHEGHLKVIDKAAKLFEKVYVVIANNDFKEGQSDIQKRLDKVLKEMKHKNVEAIFLEKDKYLGTLAKELEVNYLVRSARNNTDFSYELDMSKLNKEINNELETILIIPDYEDIEYSSSKFRDFEIDKSK